MATHLFDTRRLPRRQTQALLADLCGVPLSLGTLCALEADPARALVASSAELASEVLLVPLLGVEVTGWKEAGTASAQWTPRSGQR